MAEPKPARTVAQNMGIKPGSRTLIKDAPASALEAMGLPDLDLIEQASGEFDYLHLFVHRQDQLRSRFPELRDHLRVGGMLWVSWPKGGRLGTDLNLKVVIEICYDLGMVESICLRIDDVWSGLKFTYPKPGREYANRYGTLPQQRA